MSLMLRKQSQDVLDRFNLQNFHVAIKADPKNLTIVTECGKPMADIHGIVFNRMSPTPDEIAYAVTLLEDFLTTHKVQFDVYLKAKQKLGKMTEYTMKLNDMSITIDHTYDDKPDKAYCYYEDQMFLVRLNDKGLVDKIDIPGGKCSEIELADLDDFKYDASKLNAAWTYFKAWDKYTKAEEKVTKLFQELSTCDI